MIQTSFFEEEEEIFIDPNGLNPVKMEDLIKDKNIPKDKFLIYPSGGYHPFYGVPNTFPIYQEKIWPYIKTINKIKTGRPNKFIGQMTCDFGTTGYPRVNFSGAGEKYVGWDQKIHRLIAQAFIPNPKNHPVVMHRNDDHTNYLISNLKWGTYSENNTGKVGKRPDTNEDKYKNMLLKGIVKG